MKKVNGIYIICVLIAAVAFAACSNDPLPGTGEEPNVPVEWNGYIHFGAGDMDKTAITRATNLVESFEDANVTDKNFGVIAFQYTSDWNTFKATGKPESSKFPCPTIVTYDKTNKYWTYDASDRNDGYNLVNWDNSSKYTFFAYYPSSWGELSVPLETITTAGVPKVTYTMPSTTDPAQLRDVMIASVKDAQNNSDGTVYFHFRHCLSCLTIDARNLDKVEETGAADQTISNLTLNLTSNLYSTLSIPLDNTIDPTPSGTKVGANFTYSNTTTAITVPLIANEGADKDKIKVVSISQDNNVFLIPQKANGTNGHLQGYITFTDKDGRIQTGDASKDKVSGYNYDMSLQFDSDKDFEAGRKYTLIINFANGKISVAIIESGDWEDVMIDHTFE